MGQPLQERVTVGDAPHGRSLLLGALEHQPTELVDSRRAGAVVQEIDVLDPAKVSTNVRCVDVEAVKEHETSRVTVVNTLACSTVLLAAPTKFKRLIPTSVTQTMTARKMRNFAPSFWKPIIQYLSD